MSKYINPFTDFGFKRIFGEEFNKDRLIDFLNELLHEEEGVIKNITYMTSERREKFADKMLYKVKLTDIETQRVFYDKLTTIYLEVPKFHKTESELETRFDQWLYVLITQLLRALSMEMIEDNVYVTICALRLNNALVISPAQLIV